MDCCREAAPRGYPEVNSTTKASNTTTAITTPHHDGFPGPDGGHLTRPYGDEEEPNRHETEPGRSEWLPREKRNPDAQGRREGDLGRSTSGAHKGLPKRRREPAAHLGRVATVGTSGEGV